MKILLYSEAQSVFVKSGVGKALDHQIEALRSAGVLHTLDPNEEYDIAHINTIGFGGERVLKKSQKENKPVIYHTHTTFEDFRNSFLFSNTLSYYIRHRAHKLYKKADHLIFPSVYTENLLRGYEIKTPGNVISNGVQTAKFRKNEELALKFKKEYKIKKPVIMSVGLPFERKGIFDFCEVAKSLPEFDFYWFGARLTSLFPRKVKKLIKNPPKNVYFPGYVEEDILLGAFSEASLFFFPTYEENEGIVVLEALSMECPVLLRDIPVYKKWMKDGYNCYKGEDNHDFKNKIKEIVTKKDNAAVIKHGIGTAKERDLKRVGEKLKEVYISLLSKK